MQIRQNDRVQMGLTHSTHCKPDELNSFSFIIFIIPATQEANMIKNPRSA